MNPLLLCPALLAAIHADLPMKTVPTGYDSGVCHYDGVVARGYTLSTEGDARTAIAARYGDAIDVSTGNETIVTWSDLDRPRNLAKDGIRMIVLVKQGTFSKVHVSALPVPAPTPEPKPVMPTSPVPPAPSTQGKPPIARTTAR